MRIRLYRHRKAGTIGHILSGVGQFWRWFSFARAPGLQRAELVISLWRRRWEKQYLVIGRNSACNWVSNLASAAPLPRTYA